MKREVKKEKRKGGLTEKIFEGVEVILSSGAKIKLVSFNWCCLQD